MAAGPRPGRDGRVTPRELDADVVHARLRLIRELLDDLEDVGEATKERLEQERLTRRAIERILGQLVDLAVSVNGHVAAALLDRGPSDYRNSFRLAAEAGAIGEDLARDLAPSAGLRNVLIHEYTAIDLDRVARSVPVALDGYRRYVSEVARFLKERRPE